MEDRFPPQKARLFGDPGFRGTRILIAGLGLIGGSAAKALKAAGYSELIGFDSDRNTLSKATREGVISQGYSDISELPEAGLIICCLPPAASVELCRNVQSRLADGGVFAETGGLKSGIIDSIAAALEGNRELLSLHPMAGKEKSGYDNSDAELFRGSVLIFTPTKKTRINAIMWASILQSALGCCDIRELSAKRHDEVIARVSHLPHVAALAIKAMEGDEALQPFTGGSYKSATRVADINPALWAELLSANKDNVLASISLLKDSLGRIENALAGGNISELETLLSEISKHGV